MKFYDISHVIWSHVYGVTTSWLPTPWSIAQNLPRCFTPSKCHKYHDTGINVTSYKLIEKYGLSSSDSHKIHQRLAALFTDKVKVKFSRYRPGVAQRVGRVISLFFHDRGTRRGWVVSSTPRPHFTPGKNTVPILQEVGWAPGPVWTGGKSRPHRDSIRDRPARSQSLYQLSYPDHTEWPRGFQEVKVPRLHDKGTGWW